MRYFDWNATLQPIADALVGVVAPVVTGSVPIFPAGVRQHAGGALMRGARPRSALSYRARAERCRAHCAASCDRQGPLRRSHGLEAATPEVLAKVPALLRR
jgi:hypothetical protein